MSDGLWSFYLKTVVDVWLEDGRVLVHCFAGCGVSEILGAVGLDFDALFPPKPIDHAPPMRRPFPAADVLAFDSRLASLGEQVTAAELTELERGLESALRLQLNPNER